MDERHTLVQMLRHLLKEMDIVGAQGAGYYTCSPFATRFNRLLGEAMRLQGDTGIMATFAPLNTVDPKDPADKSKVLLEIRIEIGQLISLLECSGAESAT